MKPSGRKLPILLACALAVPLVNSAEPQAPPNITRGTANTWNIGWNGVAFRTYFLECGVDLSHWMFAPVIDYGLGPKSYGMASSGNSRAFARLVYTDIPTSDPEGADFDGDGFTSYEEIHILGTHPLSADSDGNGVPDGGEDSDGDGFADGWELVQFGDLSHASGSDGDGDGLSDLVESLIRSDPSVGHESPAGGISELTIYIPN